jgi:hypothetical protein
MPAIAAPTHDLPIITTEEGVKSIYSFHFDLTQDDLGYKLPAQGRPAAPHHVHVYADTVELNGPLVLPGKNVGIFTRRVVLGKSASIDVSGSDAAVTFRPGDPPAQTNHDAGARGNDGKDASGGSASGKVTIVADEAVRSDGASGAPALRTFGFAAGITGSFQRAIQQHGSGSKLGSFTVPIDYSWNYRDDRPCNAVIQLKATVEFPETPLANFGSLKLEEVRDNGDGRSVTLVVSAHGLKAEIPARAAIARMNMQDRNAAPELMPVVADPISLHAEIDIVRDDSRWKTAPGAIRATAQLSLKPGSKTGDEALRKCIIALIGSGISGAATSGLAATLKALAEAACADLNRELGSPNLVLLAQGGTGGRGQDGHSGVQGKKGDNGRPTSTYVVVDAAGHYATPPETAGKKGAPGGQAGSAGRSGDGGGGGEIVLHVRKWGAVSLILSVDPGVGGPPASPGDKGRGGDGGDGAEFLIHKYNSREVETVAGPYGPRGDEGPAAPFSGNRGNPGLPGAVSVNGAPLQNAIPAASFDVMAPFMKLEQLLMVQRIGKLGYLNAASDADYQLAASLFLWLCNINPDSLPAGAARNSRLALRSSARVEMMRMQQGLDYFGHPYNWAPVLNLRHNQQRVTELIGLGKLVEEQLEIYNNSNKTAVEKIAALNNTVAKVTADLARTGAASDALQKQIDAAEKACNSLRKDVENQVVVMNRHREEIEAEIRKKIDDQCNLENVVKIGIALVNVGKGAFDGISAIKGATEFAEIVKEAKAAAELIGKAQDAIEKVQKVVGDLKSLGRQLSIVDDAIKANKPDSVKIAVAREEFEENLEPLLEKFPAKTKELRNAVRAFFDLNQARNEKILAYNALFVQKAELQTLAEQLKAEIQSLQVTISDNKQALVPAPYTTFFRSALAWSKQNLIQLLYEESRALYYYTGTPRKELTEKLSDLNFAALADTQARLLTEYDNFLKSIGRPYGEITDVKVTISKDDQPAVFEALPDTGRITFTIDHRHPNFRNLTLVKASSVSVHLPEVQHGNSDELDVALMMFGEGAVRPVDLLDDKAVVRFNCPPRPISFRYSFDSGRDNPIVEAGLIGDHEFAALSPFTTWTLDFGLTAGLNRWLDLASVRSIELRISGNAFGRRAMKSTGALSPS